MSGFRNSLVALLVMMALSGCMASLPDIPPKSSGQGVVDVLHWELDTDNMSLENKWNHAIVLSIVDSNGTEVWTAGTNSIKIPGYTPGIERTWQQKLPAGQYSVIVGCYFNISPKYLPSRFETLPLARKYKLNINLESGEYIALQAYRARARKEVVVVDNNGRGFWAPSFHPECRIKTRTYRAKK